MHINPNISHKDGWKYDWKPFHISITSIRICLKKVKNKVNQKYPYLLGSKFVNGDFFCLLLTCICLFTFGDINVVTVEGGFNKKNRKYIC
jgi:hypothetical protein